MTTTVYLHSNKERMYDIGQQLGLTGEALYKFTYALYEVGIVINVDRETGKAEIVQVDDKKLVKE